MSRQETNLFQSFIHFILYTSFPRNDNNALIHYKFKEPKLYIIDSFFNFIFKVVK